MGAVQSGSQLIQELTYEGVHAIKSYQPTMEKTMRLHSVSASFENGFVHLPQTAEWLDSYVHELISFPRGRFDDQVDSTSQALDWYKQLYFGPTVFETTCPAGLGRGILVRIVAHRMQEQCYGGLSAQTHRALRELVRGLQKGRCVCEIKPGTRLVRQWRGQTHVVTAEEEGFEYKGCAYQSLSEIARVITSTRWSGPLFFGLKGNTENTQGEEARGR